MNETIETLNKYITHNQTIVVAASGGPDSMVLLTLVNNLKQKYNLKIVCAHINHNLRKESNEEEDMVRQYCKKNDIIFENMTIDNYKTTSIENEARQKRYKFFEETVNKCKASYLLTAHHGDDLIETILMRIVRGSSLKGYAGINELTEKENYKILRPMLKNTKEEILEYANKNNIPYAIDKTNEEDTYTRNRYRKYILPKLKQEDKNVHKKFLKLNQTLNMYQNYINKEIKTKQNQIVQNNKIDIEKLKQEDILIQINIINNLLEEIYKDQITKITDKHTESILNLINSKQNKKIDLPNNKQAIKSYSTLEIKEKQPNQEYQIELTNKIILPNNHIIEIIKETNSNSNNIIKLNTKELNVPLYIRNKKNGDTIEVKGLNGHKKVKDIFIDEKVPREDRINYPVLVDSKNQILWLPGLKKSKFDKQKDQNYDIIIKYH